MRGGGRGGGGAPAMIPGFAGKGWMCLLRASPIKSFRQAVRCLLCQTLPAFLMSSSNRALPHSRLPFTPHTHTTPPPTLGDRCQKSPLG